MAHSAPSRSPEVFRDLLYQWRLGIHRPMPWVGEKDPYRIWVSEVILQQTRVDQGLSYYLRFLQVFPNLAALAAAPEEQLFKIWEGLGYYNRARNMQFTARYLLQNHGGHFPESYEGLLALKGIGSYTASAIASFAFGLPHVVVDGNVLRILSRIWGIVTAVDTVSGRREVEAIANQLLDRVNPGRFNQALMDFGAVQCVPQRPACTECPFQQMCVAYQTAQVAQLPVKKPKAARSNRYFHYILPLYGEYTWVQIRKPGDIWAGLYEFPLLETDSMELPSDRWTALDFLASLPVGIAGQPYAPSSIFRQTLSHQQIMARFWKVELTQPLSASLEANWERIRVSELSARPFPRLLRWYIDSLASPGLLF